MPIPITPGAVVTSEIILRPASGRFASAAVSSVTWFRLSAVFKTGTCPVTSTDCAAVASFMDTGIFRFWLVSSVNATAVWLNPLASTVIWYEPGARLTKR